MLRGAASAANAITGEEVARAASLGIVAASTAGEALVQGTRAWCERRQVSRGRRPVNVSGNALSILSTPSTATEEGQGFATATAAIATDAGATTTARQEAILSTCQATTTRLQEILQKESAEKNGMMETLAQMQKKIDEVMNENTGLKRHLETIEHNYYNNVVNKMEELSEENNAEIRLLKMQMAKFNRQTDADEDDSVKRELEFQEAFIQQSPEQATASKKKTLTARGGGDNVMQFNIGSVEEEQDNIVCTDKQAQYIIRQATNKQSLVLL